jgi:hypothetical protein
MSSARQTRSSKGGIRRSIWWGLGSFPLSQMPLNAAASPLCWAATAQASRSNLMTQTLHRRRFKRWRLIQRLNSILNCASQCDVRVVRYEAGPDCVYAMFSGGGLGWFADQVKAGNHLLDPASNGALPDLSGLSCRWGLAPARHGIVLSAVIAPRGSDPRFAALMEEIIALVATLENSGNPVTLDALAPGPAAQAIELEAAAKTATGDWPWMARIKSTLLYALSYLAFQFRLKAGGRDMDVYMESIITNADFRKFDDALYLTLDCSPAFAEDLDRRLEAAAEFARYGTFIQRYALLTCFLLLNDNIGRPLRRKTNSLAHIHFIDGASGGYAMASKAMKNRS